MEKSRDAIRAKALAVNLDPVRYGSFAEIGAGQEVVRWFFQAGGAAGTISKSISAYDMQVSDAIYGSCQRYVCKERLVAMLAKEQDLNRERLLESRGHDTGFFAFADTVSARNFHGTNECHGWMGVKFQNEPGAPDSQILLHVRMLDIENALQQDALGIVGVNLTHAAFNYTSEPARILAALTDSIGAGRIEVDVAEFSGGAFVDTDNRVMALELVRLGLTGAALFSATGEVLQPSSALRKRPLLIERGRFRPLTHVNIDLMNQAQAAFEPHCANEAKAVLPIFEIAMQNLTREGDICVDDFLSRADALATTGHLVMISDFPEYYRLAEYLYRYTHCPIGLALGLHTLAELFDEKYYEILDGGLFEAFGRLFKNRLQLLVYPALDAGSDQVSTLHNTDVAGEARELLAWLTRRESVLALRPGDPELLKVHSHEVLAMIAAGDADWGQYVPAEVEKIIRRDGLFGFRDAGCQRLA